MAKKVHETILEIGAKLAGSFGQAFGAAQKRMQQLGKTAQAIGRRFQQVAKWIVGIGAVAFGALAAFGIGKVFQKIFGGAEQEARRYLTAQQQIGSLIEANHRRQRIANPAVQAAKHTAALMKTADELSKVGVISDDIYNAAVRTLAKYGQSPGAIQKMLGPMGDMLVATKGIDASIGDMEGAASAIGRAIQGGPTRALRDYGIEITKTQKQWQAMTQAARYEEISKQIEKFAGANAKALQSDLGAIKNLDNQISSFSRSIGLMLIPVQAEMARFWTENLPTIQPIVERVFGAITNAMKDFINWMRTDLIPALKEIHKFFTTGDFLEAWNKLGDAWNRLAEVVGPSLSKLFKNLFPEGQNLGEVIGKELVQAINDFATAIEKVAGFIAWASDLDKVGESAKQLGENIKNIPVIGDILPENFAEGFAREVKTTFEQIGHWLTDPVGAAKKEWNEAVELFGRMGDGIKNGATIARDAVKNFLAFEVPVGAVTEPIGKAFQDAWDKAKEIWANVSGIFSDTASQIQGALTAVTEAIKKPFLDAINAIQDAWNKLVNAITSFDVGAIAKDIGGKVASAADPRNWFGKTKGAQHGGIFTSPVVREIAEAGTPEAVIPLEKTGHSLDLLMQAARAMGIAPGQFQTPGHLGGFGKIPELKAPDWMAGLGGHLSKAADALGMGGGGAAHGATNVGPTSMNFAPVITVNGSMDGADRGALDQQLRRLADDFQRQFGQMQDHDRRLAFE